MVDKFIPYEQAKGQLSLREKAGQLFMPAVFINDSEEEVQRMESLIQEHHIGSICFFHSRASAATNFEGKKEVIYNENSYGRLTQLIARYQKAATYPLLIAIDAEWGLAMRIENTPQYPYAITLGAIQNKEDLIFEVGKQIGEDCKRAGIHWNLAPVVDINNNPLNPVIGYRSFGDKKAMVTAYAASFIEGMSSAGVLNALKHFPGHGNTATDSHLGLPMIQGSKEELSENELFPFQQLITKGVDSVMVGHLAVPSLDYSGGPATTSYPIITNLLRKELGFEGVVISDALNMHAVSKKFEQKGALEVAALTAGMDVMCFSEYPAEAIELFMESDFHEQIEHSFKRVWELKEKVFLNPLESPNKAVDRSKKLNLRLAEHTITNCYSNSEFVNRLRQDKFLNLAINNSTANIFSAGLENHFEYQQQDITRENLNQFQAILDSEEPVVLALFPPAVKPKANFGFEKDVLEFAQRLIKKANVVVYLFGNPYVLNLLGCSNLSNVVVVYQDFPEFQEVALQHFHGQMEAKGKLPVQLKVPNL